jgi:hypothetical protein
MMLCQVSECSKSGLSDPIPRVVNFVTKLTAGALPSFFHGELDQAETGSRLNKHSRQLLTIAPTDYDRC